MRLRTDIFFLFLGYSRCKADKDEDENMTTNSAGDNSKDAPVSDSSGDPNIPIDDLLILFILIFFGTTFLCFFIRYLLRRRQAGLKDTKTTEDKATRRYRFGRIRKNSRGKPWFYPLDPLPKPPAMLIESTTNDHDADNLIQSNISTESTLNLHDPFGVSASSAKTKSSWTDFVGVASAAILSLVFILILSSFEE